MAGDASSPTTSAERAIPPSARSAPRFTLGTLRASAHQTLIAQAQIAAASSR
jgi:hypothetical protein